MVHTRPQQIVTDVTMVHDEVDLKTAADKKYKTHSEACARQGCVFIPLAMYTRGTLGSAAEQFINTVSKALMPSMQSAFKNEVRHAISVAAARGRAAALVTAHDRLTWQQ